MQRHSPRAAVHHPIDIKSIHFDTHFISPHPWTRRPQHKEAQEQKPRYLREPYATEARSSLKHRNGRESCVWAAYDHPRTLDATLSSE